MSNYFLDSNAIVKYYVQEVGTAWIKEIINSHLNQRIICVISIAEVASALSQLQRTTRLGKKRIRRVYDKFREDIRSGVFLSHPVNIPTLDLAAELALRYPLKGFDATQVASALMASKILGTSIVFISGDKQALNAAKREGLLCENPFDHASAEEMEQPRK